MRNIGLYIHVPFCVRKCPYCDFYSVAENVSRKYTEFSEAVIRNIKRYKKTYQDLIIDTVYFGGGTPSLLPACFFKSVISEISDILSNNPEITMELNPMTADADKLRALRQTGVNRLSVGVQSADDRELGYLGRIHSFSKAEEIINSAYQSGFENISADLMIGIKGQTTDSLRNSISAITALPVKHISAYMLKIEKGTAYYESNMARQIPDEDLTAQLYLQAVKDLDDNGFKQYEISNFAKAGALSRHNMKYWHCQEYIGIGPSAHSFFNGKRYEVPRDLDLFIKSSIQTEIVNEENPGDFFEKAMLALRLSEGLDMSLYPQYINSVMKRVEKYKNTDLLNINNNTISFSAQGFLLSNSLIADLLSDI